MSFHGGGATCGFDEDTQLVNGTHDDEAMRQKRLAKLDVDCLACVGYCQLRKWGPASVLSSDRLASYFSTEQPAGLSRRCALRIGNISHLGL
jgi:hypothetical protein